MGFSVRAGSAVIPPGGEWIDVLGGEDSCAAPRIVLIASSAPLRCRVGWSAGASDHAVELSLGRGAKLGLWARSIRVWARHPGGNNDIIAKASIADGWESTRNATNAIHEEVELGTSTWEVPEWALTVRLDLAVRSELVNSSITLRDGAGADRAQVLGSEQPEDGLSLAGIDQVIVNATAAGRLLFHLAF